MHCVFITTVFWRSGDYFKTSIADYKSMAPTHPRMTQVSAKNAGWHIWFCRPLVFGCLVGSYQSCQDKAFTEPDCFPEELKTSEKMHTSWHKTFTWAPTLLNTGFHAERKAIKYWLQQNWQSLSDSGNIRTFMQNNKNLCSTDTFGFPAAFRSCSTNKTKQLLHHHHHSPLLQLFRHKLSLSFPLNMWLPRKGKNQSSYCQNSTIFLHRQIFQYNACNFPCTQVLKNSHKTFLKHEKPIVTEGICLLRAEIGKWAYNWQPQSLAQPLQ